MPDVTISWAIEAALKCDWASAIAANTSLLKNNPLDIDCLNRLGKAYLESGENKKAATFFRKVLKIDKYNPIAAKNLARAQSLKQPAKIGSRAITNFLEEPGKTKLVTLVNVAPAATLLKQDHADSLTLLPKRHTVIVQDREANYLGALPDDLGHRLGILMKGGNRYEAIAKSVTRNSITVFIRELVRAKKFHNTPSFLTTSTPDYLSFIREETTTSSKEDEEDDGAITDLHQDEEPETT